MESKKPSKGTKITGFIGSRPVTVIRHKDGRALIQDQDGDRFVVAAHKLKNIVGTFVSNIAA